MMWGMWGMWEEREEREERWNPALLAATLAIAFTAGCATTHTELIHPGANYEFFLAEDAVLQKGVPREQQPGRENEVLVLEPPEGSSVRLFGPAGLLDELQVGLETIELTPEGDFFRNGELVHRNVTRLVLKEPAIWEEVSDEGITFNLGFLIGALFSGDDEDSGGGYTPYTSSSSAPRSAPNRVQASARK